MQFQKHHSTQPGFVTLIHSKPGNGFCSRGWESPQERSSQPSCMFVEVHNSDYAATRHPAGNRKSQKRKLWG